MLRIFFSIFLITLRYLLPAQSANSESIKIIWKPINYDAQRVRLSLDYLKVRHGIIQTSPSIQPKMIVLHYTGGGTVKSMHEYFNPSQIEKGRSYNRNESALNVSSHYLVDRDGTIYKLMEDTLFARHAIGINYCAIGVENIGGPDAPLTDKQVNANIALVKHLYRKFPAIEYLIGHSEYVRFRKKPIWKETNPRYITYKSDPGDEFLRKVREGLKNYPFRNGL